MIVSKIGMELIQLTLILQIPSKGTFGKPYHSTVGIPTNMAWWIAGLFVMLIAIVAWPSGFGRD